MTAKNAQTNFWNWFIQREQELFDLDSNRVAERERIFDELASELQKVDPDLSFEFGPEAPRREFVISASGIKRAFPAVVSLADAAPALSRWQVTGFRPRRWPLHVVQIGDKRVDPDDVEFSLRDNGKMVGIYLFIPDFQESDTALKQIGYLMLDFTLGEYDVETRLGLITMLAPQTRTEGDRYPLAELPVRFDELVAHLEGHSGRSSN
jgi:hypothetical protein